MTIERSILLLGDSNLVNLANLLTNDKSLPRLSAYCAPYDQVFQILIDESNEVWRRSPDFAMVWTRLESVTKHFESLLHFHSMQSRDFAEMQDEVDAYAELLIVASKRVHSLFVPMWTMPKFLRGWGLLDIIKPFGLRNVLLSCAMRLIKNLSASTNIYVLDPEQWMGTEVELYSPKLWYLSKTYYSIETLRLACSDLKAGIRTLSGNSRKVVIVDLDQTLWDGIVGESGWENLNLGGHDAIGEAYADFQRALADLTRRGVLLGIVSKNEETVALEAIQKHPEMILKLDDFAGWRINWQDKAVNILELANELNLGLDSIVFIDDNPVERRRVKDALPEVLVPDWPQDPMMFSKYLLEMNCFDQIARTVEDGNRTQYYVVERKRRESARRITSVQEWLQTLGIQVKIEGPHPETVSRIIQLFNKTNQMNLSTRRLSASELLEWVSGENRRLWALSTGDKFGDLGLTGVLSLEWNTRSATIIDFILSCRVFGKSIEETMAYVAVSFARSRKLDTVVARYSRTEKNKPCLDFWKRSGFTMEGNTFSWDTSKEFPLPAHVGLIWENDK